MKKWKERMKSKDQLLKEALWWIEESDHDPEGEELAELLDDIRTTLGLK